MSRLTSIAYCVSIIAICMTAEQCDRVTHETVTRSITENAVDNIKIKEISPGSCVAVTGVYHYPTGLAIAMVPVACPVK